MELAGQRCTLRRWRASDAGAIVRRANNLKIASQLRDRFPHPYTARDARTFIRHVMQPDSDATNLAIEVDGEAAGAVGMIQGKDIERYSAEIGYWLAEDYWGRGIAAEAVTMLTDYAFGGLNLLRLFALPFASNIQSTRVLEKAGYVREGVLHASAVKHGEPRDQVLYARVNGAWASPIRDS
jgi:ribosomal-protein-alanine N-acetyltransferase